MLRRDKKQKLKMTALKRRTRFSFRTLKTSQPGLGSTFQPGAKKLAQVLPVHHRHFLSTAPQYRTNRQRDIGA